MILGVNGNETVNQINAGKLSVPGAASIQDLSQHTGWRSAAYASLLEEASLPKPDLQNSPFLQRQKQRREERKGTVEEYVNDISGGDIVTNI